MCATSDCKVSRAIYKSKAILSTGALQRWKRYYDLRCSRPLYVLKCLVLSTSKSMLTVVYGKVAAFSFFFAWKGDCVQRSICVDFLEGRFHLKDRVIQMIILP